MTRVIDATTLVKGGRIARKHPHAGFFKHHLRGQRPTLARAYDWLAHDLGALLALQDELLKHQQEVRRQERLAALACKPAEPKPEPWDGDDFDNWDFGDEEDEPQAA